MAGNPDPDGRGVVQLFCTRCGAGLRRGRSGGVCDPCARRPDIAERLREAGFFSWEPIRRALAAYDFGYLFRAVRRTAGLTQVELGEVLELDQDRISRIERGQRQIKDIETIARIATRLGIPPMLLGFNAATTSATVRSAAPAHHLPPEPADSDDLDSLLTESGPPSCIIPECAKSQLSDGATQSPSLTQSGSAGDSAALFAAILALLTAAAQGINTGKGTMSC